MFKPITGPNSSANLLGTIVVATGSVVLDEGGSVAASGGVSVAGVATGSGAETDAATVVVGGGVASGALMGATTGSLAVSALGVVGTTAGVVAGASVGVGVAGRRRRCASADELTAAIINTLSNTCFFIEHVLS